MFEKFKDYMFYLLPSPLKRNKPQNQFRIFFGVVGEIFDELKQDIFRLRLESNISSCSTDMLYIFAQERDMQRLKGEPEDIFRNRLQMKWQIAQLAGTKQGILLALSVLGYPDCEIVPLYLTDQEKWAEINIIFPVDIDKEYTIDFRAIQAEVMKVKRASTLPHYLFRYGGTVPVKETAKGRSIFRFTVPVYSGVRYLDGTWRLDGTQLLDGCIPVIPAHIIYRFPIETREETEGKIRIENDVWRLDGAFRLDGTKKLDAYIKEERL